MILFMNVAVSLGLIAVFSVSTLTVSTRLNAESRARIQRTIAHFQEAFEQETSALRDMVFLCKNETAFIRTVNSRTSDWSVISDYVTQTIRTLSIMQNAYDSVAGVYLYAPSVKRMIGAEGTIDTDYYDAIEWIQHLSSETSISDPFQLEEGWNAFETQAVYAATIPSGGRLLALVRLERLGDLETFSALYPGQQMIVLDQDGRYFASSFQNRLQNQRETLRSMDWDIESGASLTLEGVRYDVERRDGLEFSYLLLTDADSCEREYSRIAALSVGLCAAGLLLLMALMLVNSQFLRAINRSVGTRKQVGLSEIDQIAHVMLENERFRRGEIEQAMRELLEDRQSVVSARMAERVAENFGSFEAVSLGVQRAQGALDAGQMDALIQFVQDNVNSCAVRMDACRICFLAEVQPGAAIEEIIVRYFEGFEDDLRIYIGISGVYTNPYAVQGALHQAQRRMLCGEVPGRERRCVLSRQTQMNERSLDEIAAERLVQALSELDETAARDALDNAMCEGGVQLYELRRWGEQIRTMLARQGGELDGDASAWYHPYYILSQLMDGMRHMQDADKEEAAEPVNNEFYERIMEYMQRHYMEDITLDSVAERFHVTAVHLSRWFKKANDINFSTYLSALRMNRACELLRDHPDMKITEVSSAVGIRNAATLTRQFKSFAGVTPERYRRQFIMEQDDH